MSVLSERRPRYNVARGYHTLETIVLRGTACALICLTSVVIFNHFKMVQIGPDIGRSQAQLTNLPLSRGSPSSVALIKIPVAQNSCSRLLIQLSRTNRTFTKAKSVIIHGFLPLAAGDFNRRLG